MGMLFAFLALAAWGIGDFLIQKSARKFGDWIALFFITTLGVVLVTPFVYHELGRVLASSENLLFLLAVSGIILVAALLELEALRIGKISVVEPIFASELLFTALLASFVLKEQLRIIQTTLLAFVIIGIILVATRSWSHWRRMHLERGVWLALAATIGMGMVNFLFGVGAREISPLIINWFTDLFLATVAVVYLLAHGQMDKISQDWRKHKKLLLGVGLADNAAWLCYSFSMLYLPIAIATGISESYIVLATVLGLSINHEKLRNHQWLGLAISLIAVIALAML